MDSVTIRFYARLNRFLPKHQRQQSLERFFKGTPSAKDIIESCGVPHTEVDLILADGCPAGFSHPVKNGERIAVYPLFTDLDISGITQVRPEPPDDGEIRFVLDGHLGKLASLLRLAGFDTRYLNDTDDSMLADVSAVEKRYLLTRDRNLLKRKKVVYGYHIESTDPEEQLLDVLRRFGLFGRMRPFERCLLCNATLEPVEKESVLERIPPKVAAFCDEYARCPACGRVYWAGSHYDQMSAYLDWIREKRGGRNIEDTQ